MGKKYVEYRRVREQIQGDLDFDAIRARAARLPNGSAQRADVEALIGAVERGVKIGSLARSTRNKHYRRAQDAEARAGHLELRLAQIVRVANDGLIYEDPDLKI